MRAEMAPPPRGLSARVAPLSSRWQRGAGLLQTRITRVMGHSVPSSHCRTEASRVVRNLVRTDSRLYLLVLSIFGLPAQPRTVKGATGSREIFGSDSQGGFVKHHPTE